MNPDKNRPNPDSPDGLLRRLLRGDTASQDLVPGSKQRGTFILEAPPLGRTFVYDVSEEDGDLFYTPDPCNPDAPAIPPRSCSRPPPTYAELTASSAPDPPPPGPPAAKNAPIANHKAGPAPAETTPGPKKRGRRPEAPQKPPKPPDKTKIRPRKPEHLLRAGVDPSGAVASFPFLPTPAPPPKAEPGRRKRKGWYGTKTMCDDGVLRNMSEVLHLLFQVNEILPPPEKLSDRQIADRITLMFPPKSFSPRKVSSYRASYNRGVLSCQAGPPPVRSRRYEVSTTHRNRVNILNSFGSIAAWMDATDPPDAPPRFLAHLGRRPLYSKFYEEWKQEQNRREQMIKAHHREEMRLEAELRKQQALRAPPPLEGAEE